MLAARDQENLVNAHHTTAAAKPLNQGVRAVNPKTPSVLKTPFRASKNDENRPIEFKGQKTVAKDGPSKSDRNAFVTPAPQRERAPLGLKTTNAKGNVFRTPAPPQQSLRPDRIASRPSTTRRSGRSKITVAPSEPVQTDILVEDEEEEPDYGYAPPPIKELDDPPIDFAYDQTFPQFKGANMFRGYGEIYCTSLTDENGISSRQKQEEETWRKFEKERMREASKPVHYTPLPSEDEEVEAMIAAGPKRRINESNVDTVKAKSAATLLSEADVRLPSAATRPTKASEQKAKPATGAPASRIATKQPLHRAPANVSKNTIGFPKAKQAASIIPRSEQTRQKKALSPATKVDQSGLHPKDFLQLYGQPPAGSTMSHRLYEFKLLEEELKQEADEVTEELFSTGFFTGGLEDDGDEVFQLPMPE